MYWWWCCKIQKRQLIDWGFRIFGKIPGHWFFCYKFHPSFKPKFLSSNFPEIILSCAYRASQMQQLRTQPKLRRGSMPYYRDWETRVIRDIINTWSWIFGQSYMGLILFGSYEAVFLEKFQTSYEDYDLSFFRLRNPSLWNLKRHHPSSPLQHKMQTQF